MTVDPGMNFCCGPEKLYITHYNSWYSVTYEVTNEDLWKAIDQHLIELEIKRRKLKSIGLILWKDEDIVEREDFDWSQGS